MSRLGKILIAITSALIIPLLIVLVYRIIGGTSEPFKVSDLFAYFRTKNFFVSTRAQFEIINDALNKFGTIAFNLDKEYINVEFSGWAEFAQPIGDAIETMGNWFIGIAIGVKDVVINFFNALVSILTVVWTLFLDMVDIIMWLFGFFEYVLTI